MCCCVLRVYVLWLCTNSRVCRPGTPVPMLQVMSAAAKKLDREGQEKHGDDEKWRKWHASTPSLMPRNLLLCLAPLVLLANGKCPVM